MKKSAKQEMSPSGGGLRVVSDRQLKGMLRRVFWKGVNATHQEISIPIGEVERLERVFGDWWKANR
jgi:hypothetical protein